MTTDEKHARIADALSGLWPGRTTAHTSVLAKITGLTADQIRSVSGGYAGAGRTIQAGTERVRVQHNRGVWRMSPE
jgi:hypothetical protein